MFQKNDTEIMIFLFNIYEHLKEDYDMVLIVSGLTGTGKTDWSMDLLETWYRVILQKPFDESYIANISDDVVKWVERFKHLDKFDLNIFDEGATALDSKDWQEKFSRALVKMYNVCRKKNFFSVIIHPNYFKVNKDFREDRLRATVFIRKRGEYQWFSKEGVKWLNINNDGKAYKTMDRAFPIHESTFPKYNGVLRSAYKKTSDEGVNRIIDETVIELKTQKNKNIPLTELLREDVVRMRREGKTHREIARELDASKATVTKILALEKFNNMGVGF